MMYMNIEDRAKKLNIIYGSITEVRAFVNFKVELNYTIPGLYKTLNGDLVTVKPEELGINVGDVRSIVKEDKFTVIQSYYSEQNKNKCRYTVIDENFRQLELPDNCEITAYTTVDCIDEDGMRKALFVITSKDEYIVFECNDIRRVNLGLQVNEVRVPFIDNPQMRFTIINSKSSKESIFISTVYNTGNSRVKDRKHYNEIAICKDSDIYDKSYDELRLEYLSISNIYISKDDKGNICNVVLNGIQTVGTMIKAYKDRLGVSETWVYDKGKGWEKLKTAAVGSSKKLISSEDFNIYINW